MNRRSILISFLFFTCASCVNGAHNLDYSDLEALGVVCPRRDSCKEYNTNMTFYDRNCECDSSCDFYNDCCINAIFRTHRGRNNRNNAMICQPFGGEINTGVYAVDACARDWSGPMDVRRKCQVQEDLSDPLNAAPITDIQQSITYKNRYCAECNNVPPSNLVTFQILLNCETLITNPNITVDYLWGNLEYSASLNKWGVYSWNYKIDSREFHSCRLVFGLPEYLLDNVRLCRGNTISSCAPGWRRPQVRRSCEAYTAIVYGPGDSVYRNPHCALCNGLKVDELTCDIGVFSRKKKPMSFALLLDINQSDGDRVGMTRQATPFCAGGQKYDPFFKKCRALVCALPGYVMMNGQCVRSRT